MKTNRTGFGACATIILTIAACGNAQSGVNSAPQYQLQEGPIAASKQRRVSYESVDDYKFDAAVKIMRLNAARTFRGELPSMLPAVVVLRITVDESGQIMNLWVQRAPEGDNESSRIAIAAMYRARFLPRPLNLANGPDRSLSYSETFLFNDDNRFQIRTLAPIQMPDW
jgi:protein TonB